MLDEKTRKGIGRKFDKLAREISSYRKEELRNPVTFRKVERLIAEIEALFEAYSGKKTRSAPNTLGK